MIEGKFGHYANNISAKWLLARLRARAGSRTVKGERLGYLGGSFNILIERLSEEFVKNGGTIQTGFKVESIDKKGGIFFINKSLKFDQVVLTVPRLSIIDNSLLEDPSTTVEMTEGEVGMTVPNERASEIYLGVICAVLTLRKKLTPFYWTTVLDRGFPFKVMVEQINLLGRELYHGNSILYLGQYIESDSDLFKSSDNTIKELYLESLSKIFPNVDRNIIDIRIFRSKYAQPVIKSGYICPTFETNERGFYEMTMAHIFPNDRGINDAILNAKKLCRVILRKS